MYRSYRLFWICWLTVCGLWSDTAWAQYQKNPLEVRTDSLVLALQAQGVDTICVYEDYCVGCRGGRVTEDSPCATKGILVPTYIFWKQSGNTYRRYLDNCQLLPAQRINTTMWDYFDKHHSRIRTEEIRPFHVQEKGDAEPDRVTRSHGGNYSYTLLIQQDTINHYYDDFALRKSTKWGKEKWRNIYYRSNHRSPVYRFQLRLADAAAANGH